MFSIGYTKIVSGKIVSGLCLPPIVTECVQKLFPPTLCIFNYSKREGNSHFMFLSLNKVEIRAFFIYDNFTSYKLQLSN